jgi:hypothetical protein
MNEDCDINSKNENKHIHKKNNSLNEDLLKEAKEIVEEVKDLEEKVIVFIRDSKSIFDHMFSCCNGKKDVVEDEENK